MHKIKNDKSTKLKDVVIAPKVGECIQDFIGHSRWMGFPRWGHYEMNFICFILNKYIAIQFEDYSQVLCPYSPLPIETQSDDWDLNRRFELELSNFSIHHHGLSQSENWNLKITDWESQIESSIHQIWPIERIEISYISIHWQKFIYSLVTYSYVTSEFI